MTLDVVTSTLCMFGSEALMLIDLGATLFYIL